MHLGDKISSARKKLWTGTRRQREGAERACHGDKFTQGKFEDENTERRSRAYLPR